ncbi:MAG: NUDIX hydrolase [Lentimonas sp.]
MCKRKYQVGVVPVTKDGMVVLVTARTTGYWIFPKGRTEKGRCDRDVALDEAYEEAGLEGSLKPKYYELDAYSRKAAKLRLYPMRVKEVMRRYPERDERKRVIVSFEEAEKMLQKDLRPVLKVMRKMAS